MRGISFGTLFVAAAALAACNGTAVPDSGAGVGFNDYVSYDAARAQREAELANGAINGGPVISSEPIGEGDIGADTMAALGTSAPTYDAPLDATQIASAAPVAIDTNNPGLSDENSFDAVTSRESIADNAAKIAAQREAYQVIPPEPLPERTGDNESSVVKFALSTTNQVGQAIYSRSIIGAQSRYQRNCAKYPSPDKAQEAFLNRGGPKRDAMGLDPDGDGFACSWDPAPFRLAARG